MQVETFECSETAAEPIEANEEAARIIEQLGLKGQQELVCPQSKDENARCPYPQATAEQRWVFSTLCPDATEISKYKRSPIPLRVLQVAAHAISLEFFTELRVWDKATEAIKDPVLVGLVGSSYSPTAIHLLARWGDELESWPILLSKAAETWRNRTAATLQEIIRKATARLESTRAMTNEEIIASDRSIPSYYD